MSTLETLTLIPMYKARLRDLCRQKLWPTPVYTVERDGPDHDPRFSASVTVNGVRFDAPTLSKSSREAERKAAQVAVDHFAVTLPPQPLAVISPQKPSPQNPEIRIPYKAQLQIYAQKNTFELPKYDAVCQGYPHVLRFKASVTVDGQTFNSAQFFSSLKEAENDAAKVALLSLSLDESRLDKSYLYKTMLQELVIKEGISLTNYKTTSNGASHMPIFSSTVEALLSSCLYESRQYKSYLYKNMLQELAIKEGISLPEYKTTSNGASDVPIFSSTVEIRGSSFMGDVAKSKKQAEMNAAKVAWFKLKENEKQEDGIIVKNGSSTFAVTTILQAYQGPHLTDGTMVNGNGHTKEMSAHNKLDAEFPINKEVTIVDTISQDGTFMSSSLSDCCNHPNVNVISEFPMGRVNSPSLLCNRVEDIYLEDGLPIENVSCTISMAPTHQDDQGTPTTQDDQATHSSKEIMLNGNGHIDGSDHHKLIFSDTSSEDETSTSFESACNGNGTVDVSIPNLP